LMTYKGAQPPGPESIEYQTREANLELFIDDAYGATGVRRKHVLRRMANGDWSKPFVEHYCPEGCCGDESTEELLLHVADALAPDACPRVQRGKWGHAKDGMDWNGLISRFCGLFEVVMPVFNRAMANSDRPPVLEDFLMEPVWGVDHAVGVGAGDAGVALVAAGAAAPAAAADIDDDSHLRAGIPTLPDGSPDWGEWNRQASHLIA